MIPKIIHYCWFGHGEMSQLAKECINSWHEFMPDYEYKLWDEGNFDVNSIAYTKEAYEFGKYAFVSDYVRLHALKREGGIYLDTDVKVLKPFDDLLELPAFGGFEGSKHLPLLTAVMATEANGSWVTEMLNAYEGRHFIKNDGTLDMTTNVQFITSIMGAQGFSQNGREQKYKDLHVFPVDYFCPRQTTGEYLKTEHTYCDHIGVNSWNDVKKKHFLLRFISQKNMTRLIKLKRKLFG